MEGIGRGEHKYLALSMVTEKPVSPYTLFQKSEASFFFPLETISYLRLKLEWGKKVLEEQDPPVEESCFSKGFWDAQA